MFSHVLLCFQGFALLRHKTNSYWDFHFFLIMNIITLWSLVPGPQIATTFEYYGKFIFIHHTNDNLLCFKDNILQLRYDILHFLKTIFCYLLGETEHVPSKFSFSFLTLHTTSCIWIGTGKNSYWELKAWQQSTWGKFWKVTCCGTAGALFK